MEGEVILTTPSQLKLLLVEAVSIALKYHQPASTNTPVTNGTLIDFTGLLKEYYPGIPASTVRQDTAQLGRTRVGKRILFDRSEVEKHLQQKRQHSSSELTHQIDSEFTSQHRSRGGRKAA